MKRLTLQQKFLLVTVVSTLLLTGGLGYLAASKNSQYLYRSVEKQGVLFARTFAATIINELIYEKLGLVEEGGLIDNYVNEIYRRGDLDFLFLAILDETGKVISHNDFREFGKQYDLQFLRAIPTDGTVIVLRENSLGEKNGHLLFGSSLSIGQKSWGSLYFAVSLAEVEEQSKHVLIQVLVISIGAFIFSLLLIYLLTRRFIKPVADLAYAMEKTGNDLIDKKVEVEGHDEFARLGQSFNSMIDRLHLADIQSKEAHERLLQSEKLATLGILSSSIAHKINNPLGGLFNCLSMLEKKGDDPGFHTKYVGLIREGLDSIQETVSQLLLTGGRRRENGFKDLIVADVLKSVVTFIDYKMRAAHINFRTEIEDGLIIKMEAHDLHEIFMNVLVNALHAMPEGGELVVFGKKITTGVLLEISDTGIGVPEENREKLFDLFYTSKKAGEGTGLGLWMTHELVSKRKGTITIDSKVGKGTRVTITLPEF